jgi:hypothetical protein
MTPFPDDDDDEWEDTVYLGPVSGDDDDLVPCPYCRREILEDSPRCPYCERYISEEDRERRGKPLWLIATALVCLAAILWWVLVGF